MTSDENESNPRGTGVDSSPNEEEQSSCSEEEAEQLVDTGDWVRQLPLLDETQQYVLAFLADGREAAARIASVTGKIDAPVLSPNFEVDTKGILEYQVIPAVIRLINERFMVRDVTSTGDGTRKAVRVGENRIIKIEHGIKSGFVSGLALVAAWISFTSAVNITTGLPFAAAWILQLKDLLAAYEMIEDPDEQIIFETVAKLQSTYRAAGATVVANYDALKAGDHDAAFVQRRPQPQDIYAFIEEQAERLGTRRVTLHDVEEKLVNMKRRNVLQSDAFGYVIAF